MFARLRATLAIAVCMSANPVIATADQTRQCTVEAVTGESTRVWLDGVWSELRVSAPLSADAKVATGADSRVRIVCDDQTVVTIGVSTEVNLEQLIGPAGAGSSVVLQLVQGIVGILAPVRNWQRFEVRTPVAIASVRSTRWLVEHDEQDGSAVFVREGQVAVGVPGGARAVLGPGEGISVSASGVAGEVKVWGAPRIAGAMDALGFDWQ